jgi:hypothetical protein
VTIAELSTRYAIEIVIPHIATRAIQHAGSFPFCQIAIGPKTKMTAIAARDIVDRIPRKMIVAALHHVIPLSFTDQQAIEANKGIPNVAATTFDAPHAKDISPPVDRSRTALWSKPSSWSPRRLRRY